MCATPPPRALTSSTAPPAHDESVTPSNDDGSGEWVKPTLVRSNSHPAKVRQRKRAHTVGARTALPAVKSARSLLGWPKASTVDPPSQRIVVGVCAMDKKVGAAAACCCWSAVSCKGDHCALTSVLLSFSLLLATLPLGSGQGQTDAECPSSPATAGVQDHRVW